MRTRTKLVVAGAAALLIAVGVGMPTARADEPPIDFGQETQTCKAPSGSTPKPKGLFGLNINALLRALGVPVPVKVSKLQLIANATCETPALGCAYPVPFSTYAYCDVNATVTAKAAIGFPTGTVRIQHGTGNPETGITWSDWVPPETCSGTNQSCSHTMTRIGHRTDGLGLDSLYVRAVCSSSDTHSTVISGPSVDCNLTVHHWES